MSESRIPRLADLRARIDDPTELRAAVTAAIELCSARFRKIHDEAGADALSAQQQRTWNAIQLAENELKEAQAEMNLADAEEGRARSGRVAESRARWGSTQIGHVVPSRSGPGSEVRSAALRALDKTKLDSRSGDRVNACIKNGDAAFAAEFAARSTPEYQSAFLKLLKDPVYGQSTWSDEERSAFGACQRAMSVGTTTDGGFLVPTHLDPTIILTSAGWENPLRKLAKVVTLTGGANTWNGVTSAGVTASFDAELDQVSDDTPTVGNKAIPLEKAQAYIEYSIEAEQDILGLFNQLVGLFADAKGDLEAEKFAIGSGVSPNPTGVWTKLLATAGSHVVSTTADTMGEVDIHATYLALPKRWRRKGIWLTNPIFAAAVKRLGTAVSSSYSGDLRDPVAEKWLDHGVQTDDDAPAVSTTTALDARVIFGDFSQFAIVDKAGSMRVELVNHVIGADRRPTGARGLYAYWRVGSDVLVEDSFRLLVDKTSE